MSTTGTRILRRITLLVAIAGAMLAIPSSASAAVSCNFAGGVMDVDVTAGSTAASIERGTGGAANDVLVYDGIVGSGGVAVPCAGATVTTVETIDVDELAASQSTTLRVSLLNGTLAPGLTDETGASDEIEVDYAADNAGTDGMQIFGSGGNENVRFGALASGLGLNMNGAEADGIDSDASLTGVDTLYMDGKGGADTLTADGSGGPFSGPAPVTLTAEGGNQDDVLRTGSGSSNNIAGDAGNDDLVGGSNVDSLQVGEGNDTADGGGGGDFASYLNHNLGVTVDLRVTAPQDTGGAGIDTLSNLENVNVGNGSDTVTGTNGPNFLIGGQLSNDTGNDVLIGLDGTDQLWGGPGNDTLVGMEGNDSMIGHSGEDAISYADGSTGGVSVSLDPALTGTLQATGGAGNDTLADDAQQPGSDHRIENIVGSPFADTLTGNDSDNELTGGDGDDTLSLLGGVDVFDAYDGVHDNVDCGGAADSGTADEQGVDTLTGCEATDFAPQVAVAGGPANGATVNDSTPTYSLTADEPASFQVRVDGGGFSPCSAGCEVPSLADGTHTIAFRAVDVDEAGNPGLNPVSRTVTVDTTVPPPPPGDGGGEPTDPPGDDTPPDTRDQRAPETTVKRAKVNGDDVTLRFNSDEPGSTFECKLDKKPFKACGSPKRYRNLDDGKHKVLVVAIDPAGNRDASAAKSKFEIGGGR